MSVRTPSAFEELSEIDAANVVRCARVLLRRPLLHAGGHDDDLLPMIYRYRVVLQDVFATLLGYRLVVERRFARLYKAGADIDDTRGEPSLSPRGYAYLAVTLAVLTGIGRQALLSRLVADIRATAVEAGLRVVDDPADRRALTAALRHLVALGVLAETEGTVADASTEALITIDTDLLAHVAPAALPESTHGTVATAVRRKLVENPVVLYADLPPEQADWLRAQQAQESRLLERFFGLVTETRLEGIVAADPQDTLTDVMFPGPGTVARIALLALPGLLGGSEPRADGRHLVSTEDIRGACAKLAAAYPLAWSRQATDDIDALVRDVTALLRKLGVFVPAGDSSWLVNPVAHRWSPRPDATPAANREPEPPPQPPGWSLFDVPDEEGLQS